MAEENQKWSLDFLLPGSLRNALPPFVKEWLEQQLYCLLSYESRVQNLEKAVKTLEKEREDIDQRVQEELNRCSREIDCDVKEWFKKVKEVIREYENFKKDGRHAYAVCANGYLPKPGIRYRLSRAAYDITMKVHGLLLTAKHDHFSHFRAPSMGVALSNVDYQQFDSRVETMKNIMAALEDSSVRMIGVYGLSGVGKTTLVIKAAIEARKANLFHKVIMGNVTRKPNIRKLQGQIADTLGMMLEEETETGRAARIQERLKNEKENILVILDDLWATLDLNMLGIPSENDGGIQKNLKKEKSPGADHSVSVMKSEKHSGGAYNKMGAERFPGGSYKIKKEGPFGRYKGCKVLLISETRQVLSRQMDGEEKIFSVGVLKEKEAVALFKKMAELGDKSSESEKLAAQIAKKCKGLPMTIVTTAVALKHQSLSVWEDVHRQLERQKLTGAPEFSTKLSYDLLENDELKYTFLLCARMGDDALIMDLVKYCIGLGFLQGIYTVREARERVQWLLVMLKESSLLCDSYSSDRFTMQDIVRGAALSIASKEKHVFTMTKGRLDEWPDEDKLERYTAISLQHCDIIEEFPESINCPRLRAFHVDSNGSHLKIPEKFFKLMRELRILMLTGIHLSSLPSSIEFLTKLRMLCLERCTLGDEKLFKLSIIGELKNLRILSLSGSDIEKLPDMIKQLAKLQILDISNCSKLRVISPDVISRLTSLEELYMRNTSIQWKVEGESNQSENASLSELRHLNQLTNLDIQIPNVAHLPKDLFFDKLNSYKIVIGDLNEYLDRDFKMPEKYEASRFLALQLKAGFDNIHSQKGIKMLFERVENLLLGELDGVHDIFYELNLKGFPYLKHLSIVNNSDIKSIIKKDRKHPEKAFPKLESLCLYKLKNMEQICCSQLTKASFRKLKIIKIKLCGQLKNVFFSMVGLFTAIETIEVSECNSLKEIVLVEQQKNTDNEIEFPELRSLKLQSLSEFLGFCTIRPSAEDQQVPNREPRELFDEKVVASKLERVELSSIKIKNIWRDQPSPNTYCCDKLIHLDVNDCGNLKYLLSLSVAESLKNLQSLFVSECEMMENIFKQGDVSKVGIFPKLKKIKLSSMKMLKNIWYSKVPSDSFAKLDTLIIEKCPKLDHVFPSDMVGRFRNVCNLRVTKCKSTKVIFDLTNCRKRDAGDVTYLQDVHLEALPKLEQVWNADPEGILHFNNLQKIWVHECPRLKNIFPFSVAKGLKNLEYLVVWDCQRLKEIVAKEKGTNMMSITIKFEFPKLTTMKFSELPKLKSFYPEKHKLGWPALNNLSVELCEKLDPFRTETESPDNEPVFFPEKVIYKLKSMQIEPRDAKSLRSFIGNYRMDNLEELHLSRLMNTDILYFFLHMNPDLKSLWLDNCFFEGLMPRKRLCEEVENMGVVPMLKSLKLIDLPFLKRIGFESDPVLQRIEFLIVKKCPRLINIRPSSVSFFHLTNLEVNDCDRLVYLMAPSTARSLVQLTAMKVIQCDSMKEIVSEQGSEEQNASKEENESKIVFRKLKVLELVSLPNLTVFCSSKSCAFEFPSLEKLIMSACPSLEKFSDNVKTSPILRQIYVVHRKEDQRSCSWAGDLNATIQKMFENKIFFEAMDEVTVCDHPDLEVWQSEVGPKDSGFNSLKTLKLENCKFESHAITSNVLSCLKNLKDLQVQNCSNVKVIFDTKGTENKGTAFLLKKLTLAGLPNLKHVWDHNDGRGILSFQNLERVVVTKCENLKTLFPAALAKNLKKLEELDISYCKGLLEIVGKEEAAEAEAIEAFLFPHFTSLDLFMLPQLTCFYPEKITLDCPELICLDVLYCDKLELFPSSQETHIQGQVGTSTNRQPQPLFSDQNVISNLETLTLSGNTKMLRDGHFPVGTLHELNVLQLWFDDVDEVPRLPFEFLNMAPKLEFLLVSRCRGLKEIFPSQELKVAKEGMLGYLRTLYLYDLIELQSIGLEHSWLTRFREKLHKLYVVSCPRLTKLVHSTVSFSNLKELVVAYCDGLECLFTSSTAKSLMHLEEMSIVQCESMKEIFATEEDETRMIFEQLKTILLFSLPSLVCFYSGDAPLELPSLTQVVIWQCPKMNLFSQGSIHTESFRGIQVSSNPDDDLLLHDNLKVTAEGLFLQQERIVLGDDHPKLKEIWLGVPVPDGSFGYLKSLVVEGCEFLSNAILPSHLLPFLSKLEELKVRKCSSVEAIFDVKDIPTHHTQMIDMAPASPLHLPLKKLILEQLPILKRVWNKDPQGSLSLSSLEEILVDQCESIQSLFPASVAKDRLQKLHVQNCEGLVEIVAKDETATEEAVKELVIFPSTSSLSLWNLPNLKCIYPGMQNLDWPMLKELIVYRCQMLKIFATEFPNCPDSHPEGQDRFPADQQAFVSAEKVTPRLEQLSLNKEDVVMIEQGQLHVDLQELKFLKLQCFGDESDAFPHVFLSKVPFPSIEKLGVVDCSFKEIFPSQRPDIDYTKILSRLKGLDLNDLPKLNSIGLEHSWMGPFLENLETIVVSKCNFLKNLAPSTVSFVHLTELMVESCDGLKYLFTSSTAKSLGLLNKMSITKCESIEEIVAKEGDEPDEEEMMFRQLKILSLSLLPKLGSFYKGSSTLNFPSLEEVSFNQCRNMKIFSHGDVVPKILEGEIDGVRWFGDINAAFKRQFGEGSSLS